MKKITILSSVVLLGVIAGCNPDHSGDTQQVATAPKDAQTKAAAPGQPGATKLPNGVPLPPEAVKAMEAAKKNNPGGK